MNWMSNQDVIASGVNWSVCFDKETKKLVCSFNNEEADDNLLDSDGMVSYCEKCNRFFDVRSGCESDIRDDERNKMKDASLKV